MNFMLLKLGFREIGVDVVVYVLFFYTVRCFEGVDAFHVNLNLPKKNNLMGI